MKIQIFAILLLLTTSIFGVAQTLKDEWVVSIDNKCKILDPYFSDGVTMKWEGGCLDGKANGYGVLTKFSNGEYESTFEGNYKNGVREGAGKFTHKDGSVAVGNFIDGQLMGYGSRTSEEGNKYEGEFVNYRQHGKGKSVYLNGLIFEGFWVSDKPYTGKFIYPDGKTAFIQANEPVVEITEVKSNYNPPFEKRVTEYFDKDWKRCDQKAASYYRLVTYQSPNKPVGAVKDYYISGQLQSEFTAAYLDYDDEGKNFFEGDTKFYFKNGQIEQAYSYYNSRKNGKFITYFDNGEKESEATYIGGILHGPYIEWFYSGKLKYFAVYENNELKENKYIDVDENGTGSWVYNEDFVESEDLWVSEDEVSFSQVTEEGSLILSLNSNNSAFRYKYINLDQYSDYSIEALIQKANGKGVEGYGIVFGLKDYENYFGFLISEDGTYIISQVFEGVSVNLTQWTKSQYINRRNQPNVLKIMKVEDRFYFSINGEVVENLESEDLRGNYFGIGASGKGNFYIQDFVVKQFLKDGDYEELVSAIDDSGEISWNGNGSGIFISEKGFIATNYHVIEDSEEIQVEYFQKGEKKVYRAKVIVADKQNDLAIIQIDDPNFKILPGIPYTLSQSTADVGTDVFALGYPMADIMGEEIKLTDGKISSKTGIQGDVTVYQISVPIQPGNSGGPLFDLKGNLIGITSSGLTEELGAENVNYAIKSSYLKNLIEILPGEISIPKSTILSQKSLVEKIKILSDFIPLIRVK